MQRGHPNLVLTVDLSGRCFNFAKVGRGAAAAGAVAKTGQNVTEHINAEL